ncbi:MAG: carboxylesterase/lipase family protein [Thermaerobacter sp.]|nr:carboxylesterase/lipase family protein [Thermaerobacter sp.]
MSDHLAARALTDAGWLHGEPGRAVNVWRGVPYARPPVGALRFHPPEPVEPWVGVRDALHFGAVAPQVPSHPLLAEDGPQSEDCLTLNVWAPASPGPHPVLVWIHGGALVTGSGRRPTYDGTSFARHGVILVTLNYRLGPLGFLYLGGIAAGSANLGLLDQVAALTWVVRNIDAFGGDPGRVTVAGESAGALSIATLLCMPAARGLFQQAILESFIPVYRDRGQADRDTEAFLARLEIRGDPAPALQALPVETLLAAYQRGVAWPTVDGITLPHTLWETVARGGSMKVPLLVGSNKDEIRLWSVLDPAWHTDDPHKLVTLFEQTWGPITAAEHTHYVAGRAGPDLFDGLMQLGTMRAFQFPAQRLAAAQAGESPTWVYRFDWESTALDGRLKACHAMELPFVFNTWKAPGTELLTGSSPDRSRLANQMHQAWIAFAQHGDPNTPELPHWPPYDAGKRPTMLFAGESRMAEDPDAAARQLQEQLQTVP